MVIAFAVALEGTETLEQVLLWLGTLELISIGINA